MHCFINTQTNEISLYIVYVNYLGSLFPYFLFNLKCGNFKSKNFKHVSGIFCFAISKLHDITVILSVAVILVLFL